MSEGLFGFPDWIKTISKGFGVQMLVTLTRRVHGHAISHRQFGIIINCWKSGRRHGRDDGCVGRITLHIIRINACITRLINLRLVKICSSAWMTSENFGPAGRSGLPPRWCSTRACGKRAKSCSCRVAGAWATASARPRTRTC